MKRFLNILFTLVLMTTLLCPITASAVDGNMDGSGGGMGDGNEQSYWNPGMDGIRVTVIRSDSHEPVTIPIDFTNKKPSNIKIHFGKVSKMAYAGGLGLTPVTGTYYFVNPAQSMPKIISTSGGSNIEAIKRYFCSEYIIKRIAEITGMNYDVLIGGEFKILIEPVSYFTYNGTPMAMTAHEAALYDQQVDGKLRYWLGKMSHQNLPLAIFLETPDLGFPAWDGARSGKRTNEEIKSSLGLGIVRFEELPEPPQVTTYDYEYRTNTEVITSVMVSGGQSDPDNPTRVSFQIGGRTFNVGNIYYPSGDSQLAWIRWTTPAEPQQMTIYVTVSGSGSAQGVIHVNIVDLDKNPPPNPVADDRNDSYTRPASTPVNEHRTSASWGIWRPWWYEYIVYHSDGEGGSYPCDHGWWEFDYDRYSASLEASMKLKPDDMSPTATATTMKSGYGVNVAVTTQVRTSLSSATTDPQNAVSYFPEFQYETYWRLLERTTTGRSSRFEFQKNEYSTYRNRTHFTPIWYPDGTYRVYTWAMDCWTPAGMLSVNLTNSITIRGNLWDDWHIAPVKPD